VGPRVVSAVGRETGWAVKQSGKEVHCVVQVQDEGVEVGIATRRQEVGGCVFAI